MNYIDIDCGPEGKCPDHVIKARNFPSFRGDFETAWNKVSSNIGSKLTNSDACMAILNRHCGNKPHLSAATSVSQRKKNLICTAAYYIHVLSKENHQKAEEMKKMVVDTLVKENLFKELSIEELSNMIVAKIESPIKNKSYDMFVWDFKDNIGSMIAATFFLEVSAITYRVTKLGTLMTWSDTYPLVSEFLKALLTKLNREDQVEVDPNDLMMTLSFKDYIDSKSLNSSSITCPGSLDHRQSNSCVPERTAYNLGSIRTRIQIMKDGMYHPHALEIDSRLEKFSGNLSDGSYPLVAPAYLNEDIVGFKLVGPDSFSDQKKPYRHHLIPDPLIPFCKINDAW